jgi:hypothetical protein
LIETLQAEESIQLQDAPKLLLEWSSQWQEFVTSIGPALGRSPARLAGEAPYGIFPYRGMVPSMLLEAFLVLAAIVIPVKIRQMRPYVAPVFSSHDVIYYSGDELPRTEDLGGAQAGQKGQSGGSEAHHRTQTIRIARGGSLIAQVVDAPNLKLPTSHDSVANLLAIKPDPGPPPAEGLRSARTALTFQAPVVAPAPEVIHDYTRNGVHLDTVIAPAPTAPRDPFRTAPNLSATIVPPAPSVANERSLVAPALGSAIIAPAPRISRDRLQNSPSLQTSVVAPAPNVSHDASRSAPALAANIIPPAPGSVNREIASAPLQMTNAVVPPPVSAPERTTRRNPKLNLPAPSVIAPPPSADVAQDMRRLASGTPPDPSKSVVAPPPNVQPASGSLISSLIGKIFGASEVVPPPPNVQSGARSATDSSLPNNVVPPPPAVVTSSNAGTPNGRRGGLGISGSTNVIAPPPTEGMVGGSGNHSRSSSTAPTLGYASIVPPPPSLARSGTGSSETAGGKGSPGGTLLANNVVPPPPSASEGGSLSGSGTGRRGPGLSSPMEVGAPATAPSNSGSGGNAGVVVSNQPGSKVGLPETGGRGSLAVSPSGGEKPGVGGNGGGSSIARGSGPGSGLSGGASGAATGGSGRGSDPTARGGISPANGPGGAGNASSGNPRVPGVSVQGGSSIVTLPSFGSDPAAADDPAAASHSSLKPRRTLDVTVVATATSGGAFEPYKNQLHGDTYTTYLDTSVGTVVVEFSDGTAGRGSIAAPQGIRLDLPSATPRARMVVACTMDASGNLRNLKVLEPGPAQMTANVIAALRNWKLQPAMRGDQPVPVTAILGFGINTDDRF